jgi:hypothetical protein
LFLDPYFSKTCFVTECKKRIKVVIASIKYFFEGIRLKINFDKDFSTVINGSRSGIE